MMKMNIFGLRRNIVDDNLTLEYFLSLLDRAENVFQKDNLGEKSTDYE